MLSLNSVKSISSAETSFKVHRQLYSRYSFTDLKFWAKNDFHARFSLLGRNSRFAYPLKNSLNIRQHSVQILRSLSEQFEFVIADRFRKGVQLISLYSKWWGNLISSMFLRKLASELSKRRKFYFAACSATFFQWEKNRISDKEMSKLEKEIDYAKKFYEANNEEEAKFTPFDNVSSESECKCNRCRHLTYDGWSRLYTENNLKIWRKEHVDYPGEGLYVYKVFGRFSDVTAADFFRVQIDIDYRKKWDSNSVELNIVESDFESNSDILYWEFLFPRMFYNRDYVCNRRFSADSDKKLFTIVCKSVDHPSCPEKPPVHRVKEYWSHTIIRSTANTPEEPGLEFTITYFDNPEVRIPSSITLWYTVVGMPEYIKNQRVAALGLADSRNENVLKETTSELKNRKEKQQTPEKRVLLL